MIPKLTTSQSTNEFEKTDLIMIFQILDNAHILDYSPLGGGETATIPS